MSLDFSFPKYTLCGHKAAVTAMDISNNSEYLLSCSIDGDVRLWSLKQNRCLVGYLSFFDL